MSYLPPPPIKDFYDSEGSLRYEKVYEYLNSLFGQTFEYPTAKITFQVPSLAVPAIFEQPPQKFSVNENSLDPNILPFTLYYVFRTGNETNNRILSTDSLNIWRFDSSGQFIFIVPKNIKSKRNLNHPNPVMVIFSRQSSKSFLRGENRFSWKTPPSLFSSLFRRFKEKEISTMKLANNNYDSYKAIYPPSSMSRTLNYSRMGFQT